MPELAKCFRFTKKSDDLLQMWINGAPYDNQKQSCKMYVENYAQETKQSERTVRGPGRSD